ncbi:MAG: T9SS type A sorting domain-containing protein [Ignavibacteriaceae bacterium]
MKLLQFYLLLFSLLILNNYMLNAQWEETNGPPYIEITSSLATIITDSGDTNLYSGTYVGGVFLSTNSGDSWKNSVGNWDNNNGGFTKKNITALLPIKDDEGNLYLFAGTKGDGIFLSVNNDTNWLAVNTGLMNTYVYDIISIDTFLFAVADTAELSASGGVFRSSNKGASWIGTNNGLTETSATSLAVYKDKTGTVNLFAGTWNGGVYHSTDYGENWIKYDNELTNYSISDIVVMDTILFVAANSTVFRSINNGVSWIFANSNLPSSVSFLAVNDTIIYVLAGREIYYSLDRGLEWYDGGYVDHDIKCMKVGGKYLFLGIDAPFGISNSVWRRPLSEINKPMAIKYEPEFPYNFKLYQNYPNPFNPRTTISWEWGIGSNIQIKIFDFLGREVKTLVNQYYSPGYHSITFNARDLSSGVYFYCIGVKSEGNINIFTKTRKLLLLK